MLMTIVAIYSVIAIATVVKFYSYYDLRGRLLLLALVVPAFSLIGYPIWAAGKVIKNGQLNIIQKFGKWLLCVFINTINLPLSIAIFGVELKYRALELQNQKIVLHEHNRKYCSKKKVSSTSYEVEYFPPAFFRRFNFSHKYC